MIPRQSHSRPAVPVELNRRVLQVAKKVSTTLGNDFFNSLVEELADALRADCVYLGELIGALDDRIGTLAVYRNGEKAEDFEHALSGTAAGQVMVDGAFSCSRDARQYFPFDTELERLSAEAYVATRLSDSSGQPLGLLATVFTRRLKSVQLQRSILETFTPRAAGELERKRTNDLLKESEERHRAFISSNPDAMWRIELEQPVPASLDEEEQIERIYRFGYIAECNDAMARLVGAQRAEQLVGARFGDVAPRTDPRVQEALRLAIRSGFRSTTVETTPVDESGQRQYRLRSQFGIIEEGKLRRIWVTTRDVTDLRRAELSLQASERQFREVLESIQLPCVMLDPSGVITFCNDSLVRSVQRSREELSGKNWLETIIPHEERGKWKAAFQPPIPGQGAASHFEGVLFPVEGTPRQIAWDTVTLRDENGEVSSLAAIGRDMTDQRALETQIRVAQKLEAIGRLAASVAHDFNSLLTVIVGHTALLLAETDKSDPQYGPLSAIRDAAARCAGLTQHLLAIGSRQEVHPKVISINAVITAEENIIRGLVGEGIELVIKLEPSLGLVYADPNQIQRVVTNLVTNARDATPRGGKLIITTSGIEIHEGDTRFPADVKPGTYTRLSVSDTGIGLTEGVSKHLFEPFFTTKEPGKGTGLGLSTVYGIVTQSGGHIVVLSEPGKGTTFEILLPALTNEPGAPIPNP